MESMKSSKLKSLRDLLSTGMSPHMLGFCTVGIIFGLGAYFLPRLTVLIFMLIGYAAVWFLASWAWAICPDPFEEDE